MKLEDLLPQSPEFKLSSTGKVYALRLPNLNDRSAFAEWFGDKMQSIFDAWHWRSLCKIVYRLLIDKSDFLARKERSIDDDGIEVEQMVYGPELLHKAISNTEEAGEVFKALMSAFSKSDPMIAAVMSAKLADEEKKSRPRRSTGD